MRLITLFEDMDAKMQYLMKILLSKKSVWLRKQQKGGRPEMPGEPQQEITITPELQQKAQETIKSAAQWDPTTKREIDGMFMQFIVRDIANNGIILPEDGPPLKEALETFMKASRKQSWTGHKDINKFTNWRELQTLTNDWASKQEAVGPSSETEWVKTAKEGSRKIVEMSFTTTGGKDPGEKNYSVVELSTPISVTVYGRGTQWCTSCSLFKTIKPQELEGTINALATKQDNYGHFGQKVEGDPWSGLDAAGFMAVIKNLNGGDIANKKELKVPNSYYRNALGNAKHYLSGGPMFIIFKNGAPYIQMTNNGREMRDVKDVMLKTTSPALAVIFRGMQKSGRLSEDMFKVLERRIEGSGLKELEAKGLVPQINIKS